MLLKYIDKNKIALCRIKPPIEPWNSVLRYGIGAFASVGVLLCTPVAAGELEPSNQARLLTAYPDFLQSIEGNDLIWKDGTRTPLDDGQGPKPFESWLENPDIEDMFAVPYVAGEMTTPPAKDSDPGRARNDAFFNKIYGSCRTGEAAKNLVDVIWLAKKSGQKLKFSKLNGAAGALAAVSAELDALPSTFDRYLIPSAGTFVCRVIAGTDRVSAHGHGIAIDIATKHANYWRWAKGGPDGAVSYANEIPMEIVRVFEKHGFIWGGKWHHYDTMHFEYRPELLPIASDAQSRPLPAAPPIP